MSDWKITDYFKRGTRLYVSLENGEGSLTVFLEAGEIAALGRQGEPLYDGRPAKK